MDRRLMKSQKTHLGLKEGTIDEETIVTVETSVEGTDLDR